MNVPRRPRGGPPDPGRRLAAPARPARRRGDGWPEGCVRIRRFRDAEAGGFFATGGGHEALLVRNKDAYDGAVPSGNSVAAHVLARLARATGSVEYRDVAEGTLARRGRT